MSKKKSIDSCWEEIFSLYGITEQVKKDGSFFITAEQIGKVKEARLMAKQDYGESRPQIFRDNQLSILPITRGSYIIGSMKLYEVFSEKRDTFFTNTDVISIPVPNFIESINFSEITSEATAINSIYASNILHHFLQEDTLMPTVSGRMSSGVFSFQVDNMQKQFPPYSITVNNSQIEIDGGYEGRNSLCIIEAKNSLSEDFLIRQLYYPFRLWKDKMSKQVRPVFLSFSNGIYHLFEYAFVDPYNYNSLERIQYKKYKIENEQITIDDILDISKRVRIIQEPQIPFPQANSLERLINLCELLKADDISYDKHKIAEIYGFDERQSDYYANAGRYLGLIQKEAYSTYTLSEQGTQIFNLSLRSRKMRIVELILSHKPFKETLMLYVNECNTPSTEKVIDILRQNKLYNMSENLYYRRSSTVFNWINWILNLQTE